MSDLAATFFAEARRSFHAALLREVLRSDDKGVPTNADKDNRNSIAVARSIIASLGTETVGARLAGQMAGRQFEIICKAYLETVFSRLRHLRPGSFDVQQGKGRTITQFAQYGHLAALDKAAQTNPELAAALGSDYLIKPDLVIVRHPLSDDVINTHELLVGDDVAHHTSLRWRNSARPILHASISCKWTLRSDRAQNARSEGLNFVRNRKGRLPHIVVVTGEPLPSRIASIALGTGEIDCVYHFALPELQTAVQVLSDIKASSLLNTMISGERLRDIADLPLDLVI